MLGGEGADFLRWVAFWSIRSSVLGRLFCVTGAALRMTWHHYFWKMSRRIASFLMLSTSKNEEVSQNCFVFNSGSLENCGVFDVVNFKKWGSLTEVLRFWCCQVQKLRKSRRIVSFLMLSRSKMEEVSQNNLVLKLADCSQAARQIDR